METAEYTIQEESNGLRLDVALSQAFSDFSRTYFQYLIENQYVLVNGKFRKKREKVIAGDEVEIHFAYTEEIRLEAENIPLDILYEDEHLLAVNKSNDMVVHPAPGNPSSTLVNALLFYLKTLPENQDAPLRPGIVHRLDKETSGVILVAKSSLCHRRLIEKFQKREIHKTYHALCVGNPSDQIINLPIGRHPVKRKEMAIRETGKEAITNIKNLQSNGKFSLVEASPVTGRTHQIRVHLKAISHPIVGDPLYGLKRVNQELGESKQLLHAHEISLSHPITNQKLKIKAPLPESLLLWQEKL